MQDQLDVPVRGMSWFFVLLDFGRSQERPAQLGLAVHVMDGERLLISGETRKCLGDLISINARKELGRGPVGVKVDSNGDFVIVELHGFMTPLEQVLARYRRNHEYIVRIRQLLLESMADVWERIFNTVGLTIKEVEGEVDVERNRHTLTFRVAKLRSQVGP